MGDGGRRLGDIARIIRSKDAGNFHLTFDIIMPDAETYRRVKSAKVLTPERIATLYRVEPNRITDYVEFDQGYAFKITMRRPKVSGHIGIGEADLFGAGQYFPLLDVMVPWDEEGADTEGNDEEGER